MHHMCRLGHVKSDARHGVRQNQDPEAGFFLKLINIQLPVFRHRTIDTVHNDPEGLANRLLQHSLHLAEGRKNQNLLSTRLNLVQCRQRCIQLWTLSTLVIHRHSVIRRKRTTHPESVQRPQHTGSVVP